MNRVKRAHRVGDLIRDELSDILLKKVKDPRLEMVTITDVKVTANLRLARIYFSVYNASKGKDDAIIGFKSAFGFLKRELGSRLKLRYMPELRFCYDESIEYGAHINMVLKAVKDESNSRHSGSIETE
nr:30S ribosome-binding factor RbfA [Desulfobacterales bacterium]